MSVIKPGKDAHRVIAMAGNRTYGLNSDAYETVQPQPFSLVGDGAGSIFKIFTTAAALDMGMGINAQLQVPGSFQARGLGSSETPGCPKETWCVKNAGNYRGSMNVTDALATSPNTAFAKLIQQVGVPRAVDMAVRLGLRSYALPGTARAYDPESNESLADFIKRQNIGSFTLGPFQLNALELANVAATLASGGVWCPPSPIDKIFDRHGNEVSFASQPCDQAVPEGLANTFANALSKDSQSPGTAAGAAGSVGWNLPMSGKTGTTESHRSSGFVGFTNQYAAANYIFADSSNPSGICSFPLRECGSGDLYGGNEPARTWFEAMKPIATDFGEVHLPPTDPRYVDGAPEGRVPSVSDLNVDAARQRLKEAGFQVADQTTPVNSSASYGAVVGTTPSGQTIPWVDHHYQHQQRHPAGTAATSSAAAAGWRASRTRSLPRRSARRSWRFRGCRQSPCHCSDRHRRPNHRHRRPNRRHRHPARRARAAHNVEWVCPSVSKLWPRCGHVRDRSARVQGPMRPTVRPQSTPCRFRFTLSQTRIISAKRAEVHQNLSRRPSPHGTATRRWPVKCRRGHHGVQTRVPEPHTTASKMSDTRVCGH